MYETCLQWIIATEFEKNVGKCQIKNQREYKPMYAMDLLFSLSPFYELEEGYRKLQIRIFAYQNYVTVNIKELWNVLPREDMEFKGDEGEFFVKKGKDYIKGDSGWFHVVHHDCWMDVLGDIFRAYAGRIILIEALWMSDGWYSKHEMTEADHDEMRKLVRQRDDNDFSRNFNSRNCLLPLKPQSKEKAK